MVILEKVIIPSPFSESVRKALSRVGVQFVRPYNDDCLRCTPAQTNVLNVIVISRKGGEIVSAFVRQRQIDRQIRCERSFAQVKKQFHRNCVR